MTLAEALRLIQQQNGKSRRRQIFLVCGFQPLHLATFLGAHLIHRFPDDSIDVQTGVYGDLEGTLHLAAESQAEAAAVIIEWNDLDPRLGLRSTGGWGVSLQNDILKTSQERFNRLLAGLNAVAAKIPVALVPPTLPSTLFGHTAGWQWSLNELELQRQLATFLAESARIGGVSVIHPNCLARVSPEQSRLDAAMELRAGFPYTIAHASALGEQVVKLLFPPSPMKGLITDLDGTLWSGIVGEVGVSEVCWNLPGHAQVHGLYQQMLCHLSEMGVLIAIASKNEPAVVEAALKRQDLLLPSKCLFPICVNWGAKSASVAEILRTWNISADSVVFVDDSPMELDEVRTAFPEITCVQFPSKRPAQVLELLEQLRDLFGKSTVQREDALRSVSIRANAAMQAEAAGVVGGEFLNGLQGKLTFDCRKDPSNKRIFELINKTNQFNLNGVRLSEGEWLQQLDDENTVLMAVSYEDKFGPLGTVGVLAGRRAEDELKVTSWVLSCRAFSRRIEDHMLDHLFQHHGFGVLQLDFRPKDRNEPLRKYLSSLGLNVHAGSPLSLSREQFRNQIQALPHRVNLEN
jgi:FkbH-like protein